MRDRALMSTPKLFVVLNLNDGQSHTNDNFKFFFGGVRITEILTNFSLGGKFFVL